MNKETKITIAAFALGMLIAGFLPSEPLAASAAMDKPPYHIKTKVGPDALTGGWFINLGITGIRAKILEDKPTEFEVAYVFEGTPAAMKIKVGDRIVGVNDKKFTTPHKFGYGMKKFGYEGPMMDFADALDACQAKKERGKLTLDIIRGDEEKQIVLNVCTSYGSFAQTYPNDCAKTDRILRVSYKYLAGRQKENGTWHNRPHINTFAALALLASGEKKYLPHAKKAAHAFAKMTNDEISYGGLDCWKYTLYGIYLGEYYLATKEEWVLEELREINRWLLKAQMENGGWGHRPANRPEGNGYGSICVITMQAKMAWSLMARCGIEIDQERFKAAHDFVVRGTNKIGYVWYKDGGEKKPGYADMGRTGAAALAHALSPINKQSYSEYAKRAAKCIGDNYKTFPDTHGSPILGMAWTALGAGVDEPSFRNLMDNNRWWFTLAHCTDGTLYYQLNRDNNAQDYTAAPRLSATAATALILSMRQRRLVMMNLDE